jgi:putative heme iron utilization protein
MAEKKIDPIRETDDEARALARKLMAGAAFASLGVLEPESGFPLVSRIAVAVEREGAPFFLASDLSGHSRALGADGRASILFGEPPGKGDPLAFPRVTVIGRVEKLGREGKAHAARREFWLSKHPKAQLYVDFGDFAFWRMTVDRAHLNGGFGKAYVLTQADLKQA